MSFFQTDPVYRRFLARHPGLWREVGALDDPGFLRALRAARLACGPSIRRATRPAAANPERSSHEPH